MKATNVSKLRGAEASRVFDELKAGSDEPEAQPSISLDVDALLAEQGLTRGDAA